VQVQPELAPGVYPLRLHVNDHMFNLNIINSATLAKLGIFSSIVVRDTGTVDTTGLDLLALDLTPATVNVSSTVKTVAFEITVQDDLLGESTGVSSIALDGQCAAAT
jgi:D-ribose pyranose/furanose isomerase RbsD